MIVAKTASRLSAMRLAGDTARIIWLKGKKHEAEKEKDDQRRSVKNGIYLQRTDKVVKAERRHGRKI